MGLHCVGRPGKSDVLRHLCIHDVLPLLKEKSQQLMLKVHNEGKTAVNSGTLEEMERDVAAMHSYGLWATMERDS